MSNDETAIPLADFVRSLRQEIRRAQSDSDANVPIEVNEVRLELSISTHREAEGRSGIRFWVVDAGGSTKRGSETGQKLTIVMTPLGPDGRTKARIHAKEDK